MANARIALARGLVDGVNRVFTTPVPYVPGTTAYILNGTIHSQAVPSGPSNDFGFVETYPDGGVITVDVAPMVNDVVQIFFWDRYIAPVETVNPLTGTLRSDEAPLTGVVRDPAITKLTGTVRKPHVAGIVRGTTAARITGITRDPRLTGVIKESC